MYIYIYIYNIIIIYRYDYSSITYIQLLDEERLRPQDGAARVHDHPQEQQRGSDLSTNFTTTTTTTTTNNNHKPVHNNDT